LILSTGRDPETAECDPLLVVILGPTASGKTALSLALAEQLNGEIVSCDSVAVYREFEIGTAKPGKKERCRVPHHMIDIASPQDEVTAGDYARQARAVIDEIKARGKMPIVVGGTGLYLRALLEGLFAGPERSEELRIRLRRKSDRHTVQHLHRILSRLDPEAAGKIHPNDTPKLIRAIEVCLLAGERMSSMWQRGRDPLQGFRVLRIGLDPERNDLYHRINRRCLAMFEQGLVQETTKLLEHYRPPDFGVQDSRPVARPLASLGYRQAVSFLQGETTLPQAIDAAKQAHRNYAKRQMTWFRREPDVRWFLRFGDNPELQQQVVTRIHAEL
jgi:tRNA dimethylallyltransferase